MGAEVEKLCVNNVMGELIFQMHGNLLANGRLQANPRSALVIASCLAYLEQCDELPPHLRTLCQNLRDDWRQYLEGCIGQEGAACVA